MLGNSLAANKPKDDVLSSQQHQAHRHENEKLYKYEKENRKSTFA